MSVPEGKRSQSHLQIFVNARELSVYTIKICSNEKIFLPQYKVLTNKIIDASIDIFINCWTANNIKVVDNESYSERHGLQKTAYQECENMLTFIQIAGRLFHLDSRRVKHWGSMTKELKNMISKWGSSDNERYKQFKN